MGKFITLTGSDGQYYFNLIASNGQVILSSEAYLSDAARDNGINAVQANIFDSIRFERKISKNGHYYFVMKAPNGEIIGTSEMYISEAGRDNGIESVKNNARDAVVEIA
ncbi:MAG: YegP family protein [Rhizobacter sp.]|nr:YegP family protein [Ferruginibacter sp.]